MLATAPSDPDTEASSALETRPLLLLVKINDIENGPREIEAAREQGLIVDRETNIEEWNPEVTRRLGWFWATDPRVTETRQERRERLLADERSIDMKGFARVIRRSYPLVKQMKSKSDAIRQILDDPAHLQWLAEQQVGQGEDIEMVKARLLAEAQEKVLTAMPLRRERIGSSPVWWVRDGLDSGRRKGHLDEWYERARIRQTGRPPGSRTRHRRAAH
ncbi:hypothetical protein AB0F93_03615 [Micromonospora tulbaghiae]|uniref:hypothetical protein n=1 Tax=Micromonospora tulbaghiae TaxID=479978 RepID=UPI00331671E0